MNKGVNVNGCGGELLGRRRFLFGLVALPLSLVACARKQTPKQQVVNLYIESDGDFLAYRPDTLTCPTGALIHLSFHHAGRFVSARHTWVLTRTDQVETLTKDFLTNDGIVPKDDPRVIAATPMCDKGQTVTVDFVAPARGDYPFLCSTHPEDMTGTLHVTK